MLDSLLLTVRLWGCDARAVCDQQIHHRVPRDVHGGRRHHVAKGDRAAGSHVGCDGARNTLVVCVGAHVPLELGGRFAVDAAQVADEHAARSGTAETAGALLPLLAVMLLGVDPQVRQRGEGWQREVETERRCLTVLLPSWKTACVCVCVENDTSFA